MERTTEIKTPSAILAADLHFRDTVPSCRTDYYWEAQERKLDFILELQELHDIPVIVAGDFFNTAKSSPYLEAWLIKKISYYHERWHVVPGQHDLPNHSLELYHTSSLAVLENATAITVGRYGNMPLPIEDSETHIFPYGSTPKPSTEQNRAVERRICVAHYLVEADFPTEEHVEKAKMFLMRMQGYDLVLTGDNHQQFVVEHQGRILVNPGSMMRMSADQEDHEPAVYLWYASDNTVERVPLPIEQGVVSRKHIEKQEQRDERIEVFVTRLDDSYEIALSYQKNINSYFKKNKTRKAIRNKVWEARDYGAGQSA